MKNYKMNGSKYPNLSKAFQYADDILSNKITSCWQIFAACERFKRDLKDERFYYNYDKAERACRLIQKFPHIKGSLANKPLMLEPWQLFFLANVYGFYWKHTNYRRFTKVYILVSRKNGKSSCAAPIGLYMLGLDGEEGAEIYCVASKKDQSRVVFDVSREMANRTPAFIENAGVQTYRHHIEQPGTASIFKPLASDSNSLDGLGPHCVIFDETHAIKDRNLYGVMETALGSRKQPLLLSISTAGFDTTNVCHELQLDLEKILKQEVHDEGQFGLIYTLDPGDDFRDRSCWIKANPNLGVSLSEEYIQSMVDKAVRQPANKNNVLTKHFNVWCTASENLFDTIKLNECSDPSLRIEDFRNKKCYVGIDLSSKVDLTCFVMIFKKDGIYYIFDRSYLPEDAIESSMNASYGGWVEQGYLISTKGEAINYPQLESSLKEISKNYSIASAFYDPWSSSQFAQNMSKERIDMVEFRMNTANVSEPLKTLDALIREKKVRHNGSPLLKWCFSNVVAKEDHNDNIYFRKTHEKFKIDLVVAATMALAGWLNEEDKSSVYEGRGLRIL